MTLAVICLGALRSSDAVTLAAWRCYNRPGSVGRPVDMTEPRTIGHGGAPSPFRQASLGTRREHASRRGIGRLNHLGGEPMFTSNSHLIRTRKIQYRRFALLRVGSDRFRVPVGAAGTIVLKKRLTTIKPDRSGSVALNRYGYQIDWALCRLIELHRSGADYVLLLDYHDDVVVLDSEDPQSAEFYQIKTRDDKKAWTLTKLTKREAGKKGPLPSMLGKLCAHMINFQGSVRSLNFVSNAHFSVRKEGDEKDGPTDRVNLSELCSKVATKIKSNITAELGLTEELDFLGITFLTRSFELQECSAAALGRFVELVGEMYPDCRYRPTTAFQVVHHELTRKSKFEGSFGDEDYESLLKLKSITRTYFADILRRSGIGREQDPEAAWKAMEAELMHEGWPILLRRELRHQWTLYEVQRMQPENTLCQALCTGLRSAVAEVCATASDMGLSALVEEVLKHIPPGMHGKTYLQAAAMMEIHEYATTKLQKADPKSSKETP